MTDAEWSEVRAVMPVPAWLLKRGGRPEAYCHRTMLDAVPYLVDNGVKWTALPVDFPYWRAVYDFFRRWRAYDYARELYERLRRSARQRAGRNAEPSAGIIDSQSVDASETVGEDSRGYDGGKSRDGRKRHILTDTDGLLDAAAPLAARVAANDVQGEPQIKPQVPHVFRAFAGLLDETAAAPRAATVTQAHWTATPTRPATLCRTARRNPTRAVRTRLRVTDPLCGNTSFVSSVAFGRRWSAWRRR